jgi:hypothetical protein
MDKTEIKTAMYFDDRGYRLTFEDGSKWEQASVTTKLGIEDKPFLYKWYAELGWDQAKKKLNEAGDRGKRIHFALYVYLMGGIVLYNPYQAPVYTEDQVNEYKRMNPYFVVLSNQDEMLAMWKLQRFFEIVKPKVVDTERTVWSQKNGIVGTLDMALEIEKGTYDVNGSKKLIIPETGIYIGDLKSGAQVSESAWAQIAAYKVAWEERTGLKSKGGMVLHTSATTRSGIEGLGVPMMTTEELEPHFQFFKNASAMWEFRNPNFTLKAFSFPTLIQRGQK